MPSYTPVAMGDLSSVLPGYAIDAMREAPSRLLVARKIGN
jgi:uncharacterized FAD-dependent dehydrogenase